MKVVATLGSSTRVGHMARNEQDPAASTQQFRAFANSGEAARQGPKTGLIIGAVVGVIVVVAVIAVIALS
jgi:hypothetical protein